MKAWMALPILILAACSTYSPSAAPSPLTGDPLPISMEESRAFWTEHTFTCEEPVPASDAPLQRVHCVADYSTFDEGVLVVDYIGDGCAVHSVVASMDLRSVKDPDLQLELAQGFLGVTVPELLGSAVDVEAIGNWIRPKLGGGDASALVGGFRVEITSADGVPSVRISAG
ncbi:MAG: hypothetical protein ABIO99_08025 [Candidatus Limnocylindria bacterium]